MVEPVLPVKRGRCWEEVPKKYQICNTKSCLHDGLCPGKAKCCNSGCNGLVCMEPQTEAADVDEKPEGGAGGVGEGGGGGKGKGEKEEGRLSPGDAGLGTEIAARGEDAFPFESIHSIVIRIVDISIKSVKNEE